MAILFFTLLKIIEHKTFILLYNKTVGNPTAMLLSMRLENDVYRGILLGKLLFLNILSVSEIFIFCQDVTLF